ncbi:N-acetylglucosamine-6-phosphate deacetylase [Vibrio salinus]|uniref:N-acetylglucosamine-6-phosphate deacetylase n=1 Tax=Vibrio salinus TaxID=2899784 RepID=UPI001E408964|nr:N-acetylglucosamine-6-phosphate deacetylase [Vibrio salinus]MCE0492591.1 N-acetylglucosamine-6-phosphate deacetylase [Vibrio salinus]
MISLDNSIIFTGEQRLTTHSVLIDSGTIIDIVPSENIPTNVKHIDLKGQILCPGFIDLQQNGCGGVMFNTSPSKQTLMHMHKTNIKTGTTSFLPTLISDSDEAIRNGINACKAYMNENPNHVLGMHLEGPYTNPVRKGIHPQEQLRAPGDNMVEWLSGQTPWLKKVTLAPEMNKPEHIRALVRSGIIVSIGHTAASYQEAKQSFSYGISFATHLYNAMSPISGAREPGAVGAVLDSGSLYAGIIADGHHVHWANIRIAKQTLGNRLCLVTDGTAGSSAPKELDKFDFCGTTIYIKNGKCLDEKGTLGGSSLTMNEGVKRLVENAGVSLDEALRMASLYPAKAIGVSDHLGCIKPGFVANLIVMNQDYKVSASIVNGVIVRN